MAALALTQAEHGSQLQQRSLNAIISGQTDACIVPGPLREQDARTVTTPKHEWFNAVESRPGQQAADGDAVHESAQAAHFDGIELPQTPPPPNGSRQPQATCLDCATSDDDTSDGGASHPGHASKRPSRYEEETEGLVAAEARAWAAEQRALAAEGALESAWARAAEAEAHATAAQRSSDAHAARVKDLESQLAAALGVAPAPSGASAAPAVAAAAGLQSLSAVAGGRAVSGEEWGLENLEPMVMESWPPLGLCGGGGLSWAAEVDDAEKLRSLAELQERVEDLEQAAESASVKLAASQERMCAMCDMLRGAATIAFGGTDLSARRIRHHMFQALDADGDGFLGEADLQHWYRVNEALLETHGYEAVSVEQIRQQLTDALHNAQLPPAFAAHGKVSMLQLSRSKMGAGVVSIMLNLDNMMQDRSSAEWGASIVVSI